MKAPVDRLTVNSPIKDLIEAIEQDRQPLGSMYDGRAALEMILATYESHRRKGPLDGGRRGKAKGVGNRYFLRRNCIADEVTQDNSPLGAGWIFAPVDLLRADNQASAGW